MAETATKNGNGTTTLTPQEVARRFDDGFRKLDVLQDGTIRVSPRNGDADETVTRTLKAGRTWY